MMRVLADYEPEKVLYYFELLSSVPHGSGNTNAIADICENFAVSKKLRYYRDEYNNIIIYKPASEGCSAEPVILQGHLDMVCVKDADCVKDLTRDHVEIRTDGKTIWAEGTSLGADDVIAEAIALAILDDDTIIHPPICAVFTVDEETTMSGARNIDKSRITGQRMINLDSEEEGSVICGSAGTMRGEFRFPVIRETLSDNDICYRISISGLMGGHSGLDITKRRANAIRLLARMIYGLSLKWNIRLCSFKGGEADNAIPSYAEAVVAVPESDSEAFERLAQKHEYLFRHEYQESDPLISVSLERTESEVSGTVHRLTKTVMRCVASVPDGLRRMHEFFTDTPSVSSNIGIAELSSNSFIFRSLIRSNEAGGKEEVYDMLCSMVSHDGGTCEVSASYPEWEFRNESPLRSICIDAYRDLFGKEMNAEITHGGLETVLFSEYNRELDIISIGPQINDIHSPRENVSIESISNTYSLVLEILNRLSKEG